MRAGGDQDPRRVITVATLLWDANRHSQPFSSIYDEHWVERLYRGVARNLTQPFRFVCYVDRERAADLDCEARLAARPSGERRHVHAATEGRVMQAVVIVSIESDPVTDLMEDWERIGHALASRHGPAFRALDRRMCAIEEGEVAVSAPEVHDLGEATLIVTPPREMVEVVAEARRLGVI